MRYGIDNFNQWEIGLIISTNIRWDVQYQQIRYKNDNIINEVWNWKFQIIRDRINKFSQWEKGLIISTYERYD